MDEIHIIANKIDSLTDLTRQIYEETKHVGTHKTHIEYMQKEIAENKSSIKRIFERLEKLEIEYARTHHGNTFTNYGIDPSSFEEHAKSWMNSKITKVVLWAATIIGAVLISHWARTLIP